MKHLFTAMSAVVLLALPAHGDPQKPAATQSTTHTRANKAQADLSKSSSDTANAIIKHIAGRKAPPSNKTHGALGGDVQKPVATQASTNLKLKSDARKRRDEQTKAAQETAKVNRPSNKTHGVLGGGLLDQGSGPGQSGPAPTGAPALTSAPVARGQVIK